MSQNIGIYQTIDKPALVAYNNDLYLMWKETGDLGIYTSKSTDQGLTWSAEQRTSYGINSTIGPTFTITPDGTIHLVYRGTDSVGMLWYSNSTDFVNWNNTIQIPGNFSSTDVPSLANYNDALYLLWKGSGTDTRIYYSKRDPTTNQWSAQAQLPTTFTTSSGPAYIIAQNGTQHFVYRGTDNALRYSFRANDTATWSSPSIIASATSTEKPTLALGSAGRLHLMWRTSNNTVWSSVGTFNSTSYAFANQKQITPTISTDFGVALAFSSDRYHLVYKGADVMSPLLYATSANGEDWQSIPRIEGFSTDRPTLAVSRGSYLLMWKGAGSDTSIWRSVSYDLGNAKSWTPQAQINLLLNAKSGPSLAVSDTGLHFLTFQGLNNEVLYSTSTDGATWSDPFPSLGSTGDRPTVAVSGDTVFIMWKGVDTDNAIYVSRSDDGGENWTTLPPVGQNTLNGPTLIYTGGQNLHIAFRGTDSSVNYGKSEDGGQSWVITKLAGSTSDSPVLQSYNGKILMYWKGLVGDEQFYYSVSTTQFKDWTPATVLTQFRSKFAPALLLRNGTARIVIKGSGNDDSLYHTSGSLDIYWRASSKIAGGFSSDAPNITQYNGIIWIAWKGNGGDNYIYYTTSANAGSTWAGVVKMDDLKGTISTPSVLDWVNGTWINGPFHWNIVFRASNNNLRYGYSPNDPQRTTEIISGANSSDGPSSVIFREKLFVIYKGAPSDNRVYSVYRRWGHNYNYLWDPIQVLPASLTTLNRPTPVISDGVLNLFYRGTDSFIRLARSIDGVNWPYIKVLQGFTSHGPGATSYGEKLCVVWKLNTDSTIWFSMSDESGYTFSEQRIISGVSTINGPNVYTLNGRLHLVFIGSDNSVNHCMGHDIISWNTSIPIRSRGQVTFTTQLDNKASQVEESKLNEVSIPLKVKICFNQEIHKLSTIPNTYQSLRKAVSSLFGDRLPQTWMLSYVDSQGDKIMLSDENDLKALVEDSEDLKTVKIFIFSRDQTESADYQVIDFDAQHQIMGQTPRSGRTLDLSQNQITGASESRPELVLRAKEIVKKLTKSDLTQDRREQLEVELNSLERDLSQQEIILLQKYRVKCIEKRVEKEAQKKDELKALLLSLINEQGLANVTQNYSSQAVTQEEIKNVTLQAPQKQVKKKYPAQVQEKAQMMKNIFAGSSTEELLDFVSKSPNSPLEQLVRNYVSH